MPYFSNRMAKTFSSIVALRPFLAIFPACSHRKSISCCYPTSTKTYDLLGRYLLPPDLASINFHGTHSVDVVRKREAQYFS